MGYRGGGMGDIVALSISGPDTLKGEPRCGRAPCAVYRHHGTWYLEPGSWYLVPGTWNLVPGSWYISSTPPRGIGVRASPPLPP